MSFRRIYSKVSDGVLLHTIVRGGNALSGRLNIIDDDEYLQLALIRADKGKAFEPHKHLPCEKTVSLTQESWVVISGCVLAVLYDLDDTVIAKEILYPGDISITLRGGHACEILENNTLIYEFKTGPYMGKQLDSVSIEGGD